MALTPKADRAPASRLIAFALASGIPLACYLATASAHGYWFDGGEFVAASVDLDLSHPPGQPLAALVGHVLTWIPLGPLAFRVTLASAVFAAVAAGFLFSAIETTVRSLGVRHDLVAIPIALGATWLVAGSYGWWFQAVRPEVYALQAALLCVVLERVVALEAAWPSHDVRPIYVACLALGLALANHHFLALLVLPAMAGTLARVRRAKGLRPLALGASAVLLGLATYAYLPVRSATDPPLDLGNPTSFDRFLWVVSAQAFQKNTGAGVPLSLPERLADLAVQLVQNLHVVPILMALAGLYALLRTPGARRVGFVWLAVLGFFVAARAWLGFVRSNPDALGYLMPAFGAVGALAASFVAALIGTFSRQGPKPAKTAVLVAIVLAGLGLAQIHRSVDRATLARFSAVDAFEEVAHRDLPTRAVVLVHDPQTLFRMWGGRASANLRPDVTLVPMPMLTYPGMVGSIVDDHAELTDLLRGYLVQGTLQEADLQSLAARRPLLVEMDPRVPPSVYDSIVPHGLFHEVMPDEAYDDDRSQGIRQQRETWAALYDLLGPDRREPETGHRLLWHHYMSALYDAATGERDAALEEVKRGLAINPEAEELRGLYEVLNDPEGEGPVDIEPFMPRRLE